MENHWISAGRLLTGIGGLLVTLGLTLWMFGDRIDRLGGLGSSNFWLGNLPGDIRIDRPDFSFYMPLTTMVVVSIVISLVLWSIGQSR